jgi:hypothetical protein
LAADLASLRGVSKDAAIYVALSEAIARSEEPKPDSKTFNAAGLIRKIVFRQICLARIGANDETRSQMWKEMYTPVGFGLFYLAIAFGLQVIGVEHYSLQSMVILVVPAGVALLYYYHSRTLNQRKCEEKKSREILTEEIRRIGRGLPDNLGFLCDGAADNLIYLDSLQKDE